MTRYILDLESEKVKSIKEENVILYYETYMYMYISCMYR